MAPTLADSALRPARPLRRAREYLRVSKDKSGRAKSNEEQHSDNTVHAAREGLVLGEPYEDVKSASRYANGKRDGFDQLIADLEADQFNADVLIMWESSRGSRQLSVWAHFLELLRERGITVYVTLYGRELDPREPRDMRTLQEDGVNSEYESAMTSKRVSRGRADEAVSGKPHGRVPLGYVRIYDPVTRRLIAQVPDDSPEARAQVERLAERDNDGNFLAPLPAPAAPMIRELFERIKRGHSFLSISKDFVARGICNDAGTPYSPQHLRVLTTRHAYAGLRVHQAGRKHGNLGKDGFAVSEAVWPPLVSRETFYAVQNVISAPGRKTSRPGRGVHLMSMIGRCDICSSVVSVTNLNPKPRYTCKEAGHVSIFKDDLDHFAEDVILRYLASGQHLGRTIAESDNATAEIQVLRDQIAELEARLDALAENTTLSERVLEKRSAALERDLTTARKAERALSTPSALTGLIDPDKSLPDWWKSAPMSTKRQVAKILFTPEYIGELRIIRGPRNANQFSRPPAEERVRWRVAT